MSHASARQQLQRSLPRGAAHETARRRTTTPASPRAALRAAAASRLHRRPAQPAYRARAAPPPPPPPPPLPALPKACLLCQARRPHCSLSAPRERARLGERERERHRETETLRRPAAAACAPSSSTERCAPRAPPPPPQPPRAPRKEYPRYAAESLAQHSLSTGRASSSQQQAASWQQIEEEEQPSEEHSPQAPAPGGGSELGTKRGHAHAAGPGSPTTEQLGAWSASARAGRGAARQQAASLDQARAKSEPAGLTCGLAQVTARRASALAATGVDLHACAGARVAWTPRACAKVCQQAWLGSFALARIVST